MNKIDILAKIILYVAFVFFLITMSLYFIGCPTNTLVFWAVLTVVTYLNFIILKLASVELSETKMHLDIVDTKIAVIQAECRKSLEHLKAAIDAETKRKEANAVKDQ